MNHVKLIERRNATRYILTLVISLAITVSVTRLYLEATGYPQLGNGTFHIAHALWGGLLQAIAAILMLIYLNERVFFLSAVLAGMGIGLFVDEIGKFITQTNDYFFPLAAPLIYITVILGVLLYLYIRREDNYDARGQMYSVLDSFKSLLDERMNPQDFENLQAQLAELAQQTDRKDIASIAQALIQALQDDSNSLPPTKKDIVDRLVDIAKQIEMKYFGRTFIRRIMMLYFTVIGLASLVVIVIVASIIFEPDSLKTFSLMGIVQDNPLVASVTSLNWFIALIVTTIIIGILFLVSLGSFVSHHERFAVRVGMIGLILSLTVGNTMSFYFSQFSVMSSSILLLVLLVMLIRYRDRFLQDND